MGFILGPLSVQLPHRFASICNTLRFDAASDYGNLVGKERRETSHPPALKPPPNYRQPKDADGEVQEMWSDANQDESQR